MESVIWPKTGLIIKLILMKLLSRIELLITKINYLSLTHNPRMITKSIRTLILRNTKTF